MYRIPKESVFLIVGAMGAGKTTLAHHMRKLRLPVFETDDVKTDVTEPELKRLRRVALSVPSSESKDKWAVHNERWFSQIWGGLGLFFNRYASQNQDHPIFVLDHGGWFILDAKAFDMVAEVIFLDADRQTLLDRVTMRDPDKAAGVLPMAEISYASTEKVKTVWNQELRRLGKRASVHIDVRRQTSGAIAEDLKEFWDCFRTYTNGEYS